MNERASIEPASSKRADPFARDITAIDADLHAQVQRRENGTNEVLHGLFLIHRSSLVIDRLIEERCRAMVEKVDAGS